MTQVITSLQNPLVKQAAALHLKKHRDESGLFIVEGEEFCRAALAQGWMCDNLFILTPHPIPLPLWEGKGDGVRGSMHSVSHAVLAKISKKENPQAVIGVFRQRTDILSPASTQKIIPALEEIRDPGNLGTIMRTCHALGLRQLILIGKCCDPYAPETIRASMGAFALIDVIAMSCTDFVIWRMGQAGMVFIGTDVADAQDYRNIDYKNAVLLMGNEQKGLSPELKALCDSHVKIPMPGGAESLNVAMATTLLLYEAMRPSLK